MKFRAPVVSTSPSHPTLLRQFALGSCALLFAGSVIAQSALPSGAQGVPVGKGRNVSTTSMSIEVPPRPERPFVDELEAGPHFALNRIEVNKMSVGANGATSSSSMSDAAITRLVDRYLGQYGADSTFSRLQVLADDISDQLKREGNMLATAYIPSQRIEDGVVRVEVLMGTLGKITVMNNKRYTESQILNAFDFQEGEVVQRDKVETWMLRLQDYPGLQAGALFRPADGLGATEMVVTVSEERKMDIRVLADNYGSEYTGKGRVGAQVTMQNPLNMFDLLTVDLIWAQKPEGVQGSLADRFYGGFRYGLYPFGPKVELGIEAFRNEYAVGDVGTDRLSALNLTGQSDNIRAFTNVNLMRTRSTTWNFQGGLSVKNGKTILDGNTLTKDDLTVVDAGFNFDYRDDFLGGGVSVGMFGLSIGLPGTIGALDEDDLTQLIANGLTIGPSRTRGNADGSTRTASGKFQKYNFSYQRLQEFGINNRLLLTVNAQHSPEALLPLEQFGMGGPYNVRAYPTSAFLADRGVYTGVEFIQSFTSNIRVSVFMDYAYGRRNYNLRNENDKSELKGFGIGLATEPSDKMSLNVTSAWAVGSKRDIDIEQGGRGSEALKRPQIYASFNYRF